MKANIKKCTFDILDSYPSGTKFRGIELMREVKRRIGVTCYPETPLRHMREYRKTRGREIVNVNKARSVYEVR